MNQKSLIFDLKDGHRSFLSFTHFNEMISCEEVLAAS